VHSKLLRGRTMKISKMILRNSFLLTATLLILFSLSARAQITPVRPRITEAVDETNLVRLHGNVHPLARPEFDQGAVADAQPMQRMLLLLQRSPEQETALRQLLDDQQSKSSPNFHAWLTPEQFGKQFGPADADIQGVTDWLTRQGFQGIKVGAGRTVVEFSGNVAQVRNAFHTEIHRFVVNAEQRFANVSDPQIPAALKPAVAGVVSLHNFPKKPHYHRVGTFRRNLSTGEVKPLFTYTDSNGQFFGLGPADFAKIYNIPAGANGAGQSIAVVGQSNINIQDVRDFRTMFGLPPNDPQIILNGPDPGLVPGDEGESDLDVEWAGAAAPQANVIFVTSESTLSNPTQVSAGIDLSAVYIVDNNIAPVLSESYGQCEFFLGTTGNAFYYSLWQQAAAQGITVVISAGDNGSAGCDPTSANQTAASLGIAVSGLASTPFNVAIGGTDFNDLNSLSTYWNTANTSTTPPVVASAQSYIPEVPWNDSCAAGGSLTGCPTVASDGSDLVAGSGGPSNCINGNGTSLASCTQGYAKPAWQTGAGVPAANARYIPDVSFFAGDGLNKSFYIVCQSDQNPTPGANCNLNTSLTSPSHDFQGVGGTSGGTPTFAGIIALINQAQKNKGLSGRQGNVNYVLYNLAAQHPSAFNDIASGSNSVACQAGTANCSKPGSSGFGIIVDANGNAAWKAGTGYDLATGLGSVNVSNLITNWAAHSFTQTTTTLTSVLPNTGVALGGAVTISGSVSSNTSGVPTGTVYLIQGSTYPGPVLDSFDLAASFPFQTTVLPGGSYQVMLHYGGDGNFASSDSAPLNVNVSSAASKTVVTFVTFGTNNTPIFNTSPISVPYGSPYILRVDVETSGGTQCSTAPHTIPCPTGNVTLTDNGSPLKDFPNAQTPNATNTGLLNDLGFLEDQPIQLGAGSHSIVASYAGDSSYSSSVSTADTITITPAATTTAVSPNVSSTVSGGSVILTATVSSNSNSAQGPSSTVQFLNGSANLGAAVTCTPAGATSTAGASCTATLTTALSALPPGIIDIRQRPAPPSILLWLAALCAVLCLLLAYRMPARRRAYAYAGLAFFVVVAAGIVGCGGGSSGSGSTSHAVNITAKFSGDTNYSGSTSPTTTITVQ
jgi:hypothetical protein